MKTATITEAKNGLSALIDRVRAGESIMLTDRGVPVARIEPVTRLDDVTGRMQRLTRAGVLRVGQDRGHPGGTPRRAMRFWDTSAIVPLLVEQHSTVWLTSELERDPDILV